VLLIEAHRPMKLAIRAGCFGAATPTVRSSFGPGSWRRHLAGAGPGVRARPKVIAPRPDQLSAARLFVTLRQAVPNAQVGRRMVTHCVVCPSKRRPVADWGGARLKRVLAVALCQWLKTRPQ